ncbi:hypothetical protein BKA62DRAFT_700042 [Auriculariales sp. MPI-PUGE-AT-0066]|nr:hypothetical protein BKA62DRAFT_700042 [Auriculariales sp. MPI-PUGE-AT-0066]
MMAPSSAFVDRVVPLFIFPALAMGGAALLATHALERSFKLMFDLQCPKQGIGLTQLRIRYTGYEPLDEGVCWTVAFFHALMKPDVVDFMYYVCASAPIIWIFPSVEAARRGTGWLNFPVAFPGVTLLISQVITIGATMPLYWTFFLAGGHQHLKQTTAVISQAHAESVFVGTQVGLLAPTVAMLVYNSPKVTAFWQPAPAFSAVLQQLYLLFRRPSQNGQSGYVTIRTFYLGLFLLSATVYGTILIKRFPDVNGILSFFLPPLMPSGKVKMSVQTLNFLQLDVLLAQTSCIFASFWFADSSAEVLGMLAWHLFAVPLAGPSASFIGVLIWREDKLNGSRGAFGVQNKLRKQKKSKQE